MCKKIAIIPPIVEDIMKQRITEKQYPKVKKLVEKSALENIEHRQVLFNCGDFNNDNGVSYDWVIANSDDVLMSCSQLNIKIF